MMPATLFAKFVAEAESATEIAPFWPPTDRTTCWPRPCTVATSAFRSAAVYPPGALDSPESTVKLTPPGVPVASPNAIAIRSYVVGTSRRRNAAAPLTKSCQYPVSMCLGRLPVGGWVVGLALGLGLRDGLG